MSKPPPTVETLEQIQGTLTEIQKRTPDVSISSFVDSVWCYDLLPSEYESGGAGHLHLATAAEEPDAQPPPGAPALRMDWAACVIPLHGEDAHFGNADAGVVGVADGVGGYRDRGVDASAFARALMANAQEKVERTAEVWTLRSLCPKTLLERSYRKAARDETPGASTAVILSLHGTTLRWAYVGDSAFAVLRGGRIIYRSVQQQHRFNHPYQLSSHGYRDELTDGSMSAVKEGDVVVIATDGLFDNMHDWQLVRAVQMGTELGFSPKNMADIVAGIAYEISTCDYAWTPYSDGRSKKHGKKVYGGKEDDITVIVAYIVSKDS